MSIYHKFQNTNYINVTDYGYDGDLGVTFNRAVASNPNATNFLIPAGTYHMSTKANLPICNTVGERIKQRYSLYGYGTQIYVDASGAGFSFLPPSDDMGFVRDAQNWNIEGLFMRAGTGETGTWTGIRLVSGGQHFIKNCSFLKPEYGIKIESSMMSRIYNCTFRNCYEWGIWHSTSPYTGSTTATTAHIMGNRFYMDKCTYNGVWAPTQSVVDNNIFEGYACDTCVKISSGTVRDLYVETDCRYAVQFRSLRGRLVVDGLRRNAGRGGMIDCRRSGITNATDRMLILRNIGLDYESQSPFFDFYGYDEWDNGEAYPAEYSRVKHRGKTWITNATTTAGEEPGVSSKWDEEQAWDTIFASDGSVLQFNTGNGTEPVNGEYVAGSVSGSSGIVEEVRTDSGTWGDGNAAGYVLVQAVSGEFSSSDTLTFDVATANVVDVLTSNNENISIVVESDNFADYAKDDENWSGGTAPTRILTTSRESLVGDLVTRHGSDVSDYWSEANFPNVNKMGGIGSLGCTAVRYRISGSENSNTDPFTVFSIPNCAWRGSGGTGAIRVKLPSTTGSDKEWAFDIVARNQYLSGSVSSQLYTAHCVARVTDTPSIDQFAGYVTSTWVTSTTPKLIDLCNLRSYTITFLTFEGASGTEPDLGHAIEGSNTGAYAEIGALNINSGSFANGNAAGTIELRAEASGTFTTNDTIEFPSGVADCTSVDKYPYVYFGTDDTSWLSCYRSVTLENIRCFYNSASWTLLESVIDQFELEVNQTNADSPTAERVNFMLPVKHSTTDNTASNLPNGAMYYNTNTHQLKFVKNGSWAEVSGV